MRAGQHLLCTERRHHQARWLLVLLLGAGPLFGCLPLFKSGEWPRIPEEDVPGLTLLTPGENASFQNPTWSPDGGRLAYDFPSAPLPSRASFPADGEIFLLDLVTGESRQLTDNELPDLQPDWSPDGLEIMFVRSREVTEYPSRLQLMVVDPDGSREEVLLDCPGPCLHPKWSPDGKLVAFEMEDRIWTIRRDGSDLRQVSGEKVTSATYPGWSPDGRRLAYWATLEATSATETVQGALAVLDLSTGEETIVFSGVSPLNPDWSPTGSLLLFSDQSAPQKWWTLFTLALETEGTLRLIAPDLEYDLFDAVWSPDGKRIAFAYGFAETSSHLYLLDVAEIKALTPDPPSGP